MSWWKQLLLSLVVLAVAAGLWLRYMPGAPQMLAELGIPVPGFLAGSQETAEAGGGAPGRGGPPRFGGGGLVVTGPIVNATINDRLSAIGTGRALNSVVVTPYASGRLVEIAVQSGSEVDAGAVIARLDSQSEEIAVDRAEIALEDARARLERVTALRSSNTVTAVQEKDAEIAVRNAELALREAELALERRSIAAPISGLVGIIPVSRGDDVTATTEIARIDDRSAILVDFWVPERFAGALAVGQPLTAASVARPGEVYEGSISALDNRVDATSRTLRVEARIINPSDTLRAGMAFQIAMRFPGDTFPAVDPLAIQWGADGAYVWTVKEGVARRTPVRIVQRNADSVLVDGAFRDGDTVVVEGIHNVRDGAEVMIAGDGGKAPAPAPARGS
ncbi:efflux RND transporter periplasmic adaptor subunit [Aquibium sp. A9E412]|uniref:efflux RND transporter periplasmic adaptor subunit n=1 Tax=Aquibium sp. A9E412 TaxID=2976767 RepID=UPI0025B15AAC|nr:efflux RND transporter periplasmic adaptor subunit [Aquibium sp. A9E412]MDN2565090.1 efflux RND transporter periplasmic adaptor subunit [Aquibium sp. A9E412]